MIIGKIIAREELKEQQKIEMYDIMKKHYDNFKYENFINDLNEKDWIILIENELKVIVGFSTAKIISFEYNGKIIKGIFSGDTIVDQNIQWELEFQKTWVKFALNMLTIYKEDFYWFLLSKGYKTYRFLPLYFKEYYPNCDKETPKEIKDIMDIYAESKYKERYDKTNGIIINEGISDYLKNDYHEINNIKIRNKHIKYFLEKNIGYKEGNELVCIAEISGNNFRDSVKRMSKQ